MREIIKVLVFSNKLLLSKKSIQVSNSIPEDLPAVYADENRLQQILNNLISNAIKFTNHGKIEISAELTQSKWLEISITDTGTGIIEDKLTTLFQSFEQMDGSLIREYGGTLGLAVTKKLVELHGGKIWVKSQIGVGSKFTFTLLVAKSPANQSKLCFSKELLEKPVDVVVPVQNKISFTILIVDDEPITIQLLVNYLAPQNYTIIQADSGLKACKLVEDGLKPDLILLDVMMPGMTGYEVVRKIRLRFPINELPILMLTSNNRSSDLITGLEVGANDYLTKPIFRNELLARVKTHLHLHNLNIAYSRFVPHEFLKFLNKESIVDINLGDQVEKEMTIMFSDIRDFTSLSEKMTPEDNIDFINTYLGQMEPIIHQYQGIIDKYIGDAIMVLFPSNADDALKSAIAMLKTLTEYNQILQYTKFDMISIGIGLHTGKLMLGIVGGRNRMDSTVISDAVNLASRIEDLTKTYGTSLLISEHTYTNLADPSQYNIRVIDTTKVKGKSTVVTVYEVFDADTPDSVALKNDTIVDFESGFVLYHSGEITDAKSFFETVLQVNPQDTVAQVYLERCQKFLSMTMPKQPVILVANDMSINLKLLFEVLYKHDFEVLTAKDEKIVLETALLKNPHLILLDVMMPKIDGFEVCRQLKENPKTRDIPIIFITAFSNTNDKIKGFKLGAVDYITKPFQAEEVLSRIKTHLMIYLLHRQTQEINVKLKTQNVQLKKKIKAVATQTAFE